MESEPSNPIDKILSTALIWRLAQIVLVLAAALLYFALGRFGGDLQAARAMAWPHTVMLVKSILIGLGIGLCLGLALKDLSKGRIAFVVDWPTLIINLVAAGVFAIVAVSFNVSALLNLSLIRGPLGAAVVSSPLLPFIWMGLALTTIVQAKSG